MFFYSVTYVHYCAQKNRKLSSNKYFYRFITRIHGIGNMKSLKKLILNCPPLFFFDARHIIKDGEQFKI